RVYPEAYDALAKLTPTASYNEVARVASLVQNKPVTPETSIAVVTAGTSDLAVAEEASATAEFYGNEVQRITDVGVAGIHRLLNRVEELRDARVIVVIAGMEGALPSVVGGLVDKPIIAVPTSVGYGAAFGGIAALLGMLTSCAPGVSVVNIDNGFGAGYIANNINRL
ncbi:MAG: nickel pincer cofactor biosynthesis protein LarB, partial [Pseudomonadales bacterium]|nr:nickel pincer cofactor biosynthesis protein LarB [Pseudomonadales bacterium]